MKSREECAERKAFRSGGDAGKLLDSDFCFILEVTGLQILLFNIFIKTSATLALLAPSFCRLLLAPDHMSHHRVIIMPVEVDTKRY